MAKWRNASQTATLIRNVIYDFHKSDLKFVWKKKPEKLSVEKPKAIDKQNNSDVLPLIPKEDHLSNTYRHYLYSTMRLNVLYEQYKVTSERLIRTGGERPLEECARIVGLKLPNSSS
ncbi:unnamed protein product [Thelazia callipaeda]|uniref:Protein FMC1 homolog n=1 Tax=Thelazia callipaeda TaxID=103827 RepID=A0A0N5CRX3_THECL|nr:unnamed protein product [Thelazia callipaeda]